MVEVRVEIMARSLDEELQGCRVQYKARTSWRRGVSHDLINNIVTIVVPQEEFDNHNRQRQFSGSVIRGGDLLFLEVWVCEDELNLSLEQESNCTHNCSLAGLIKHKLDDQLQDQNLSPSIQWLEIYDPIRNISKGKVLLRIYTTYLKFKSQNTLEDKLKKLKQSTKTLANVSTMTSSTRNDEDVNDNSNFKLTKSKACMEVEVQTDNKFNLSQGTQYSFHNIEDEICLNPEDGRAKLSNNLKISSEEKLTKLHTDVIPHTHSQINYKLGMKTNPELVKQRSKVSPELNHQETDEDSDSIGKVIRLLKGSTSISVTVNGNQSKPTTTCTYRLAPEEQNSTENKFSSIQKSNSRISLQPGNGVRSNGTHRNGSGSSSSVSSARSRRIAADIYNN